jgi:fatty-acyl-CoA synthase
MFMEMRIDGPPHIGVLLENVPEFPLWLGAAALAGATIVGINPTRRGSELARDIAFTKCQVLVTDTGGRDLLKGLDLGICNDSNRVLTTDSVHYAGLLLAHRGAPLPVNDVDESTQFLLVFTSGTSGAPKAVKFSQARLNDFGSKLRAIVDLQADDVTYCVMPLFHSNALITSWLPTIASGATLALRRRFSASQFLPDVRKFGATYFNYVGKPLSYILATPEESNDSDNTLTRVYGNEASEADIGAFASRFGCVVTDGYGSSEGGVSISRIPGTPRGSLGMAAPTVCILNSDSGEECPRAEFDTAGRLLNAEDAVGEIANRAEAQVFEGYWNNNDADAERTRGGVFWTGDLGYRDSSGFFYFAGRSSEWLRVDGENLATAPIERILARFPGVQLVAVYGVPDPHVGDRPMASIVMKPGSTFEPEAFDSFLAEQSDLSSKALPRFVRVATDLPITETNKVLKRVLQQQQWFGDEPIWWRPDHRYTYHHFTARDRTQLHQQFEDRKRADLLTGLHRSGQSSLGDHATSPNEVGDKR